MNLQGLDPDTLKCVIAALENKALLYEVGGKRYAVKRDGKVGWWVYELRSGSEEYFVTDRSCTCPAHPKPCKHMRLVKHGI